MTTRAAPLLRLASALALTAASLARAQSADLTSAVPLQMSLDEKIAQLQAAAPAIPRLHVTAYNWWNEGLHGVARSGEATVFPQAIGLAATWDAELLGRVGDVISTEARVKFNAVGPGADHDRYGGLTIWSPNINIFRDPRWGRGQETYGEDPLLTGTLGSAFVTGLQGPDPEHPKAIASIKHFAVHSGPEAGRHGFDVDVSPYDRAATYLPAFRQVVTQAKPGSVMCAYNAIHGVPACASSDLLEDRLRRDWGFTGYVVTDCDAVSDMAEFHFYRPTPEQNAAAALKAGTDLNCGDYFKALKQAVQTHLVDAADIDRALGRLWLARNRLGLDGAPSPYANIGLDKLHTPQAAALALRAARESIVLLKNDGILPLGPSTKIAVIGPNADTLEILEGNYHGTPNAPVTPLQGMRTAFGKDRVVYAQGSSLAEGVAATIPESALRVDAASTSAAGLRGEYFPQGDFKAAPALTRIDRTVSLDLFNAVPVKGFERGPYAIRWSGYLLPPGTGDYQLKIYTERCWGCDERHDRVRLFVDDKAVISDSGDGAHLTADLHFDDVTAHRLRLEFQHTGADWGVRLQWQAPDQVLLNEARNVAQKVDVVVAFVGLSPDIEGEELPILVPGFDHGDRTDLALPARQSALLKAIKASGKPLVVVNLSGGAVALEWAQEQANAVLQAWYPGEAGGTAIADTLLGKSNPSGRLPVTIYRSAQDLPPFIDYRMTGRTYRYFSGRPLYGFGYGLSYTRFAYSDLQLSQAEIAPGHGVTVSATVANTGAREGDEIVQLYLGLPANPQGLQHSLTGFRRVHLQPGQRTRVTFDLSPRDLSLVEADGARYQTAGDYQLTVGGGQPDDRTSLAASLRLTGRAKLSD